MVRSNKGFTLIELMVVIVIMGVLAVLAIPKLTDVITKAKIGEIPIVLGSWEHAQMAYIAEKGECAAAITNLAFEDPNTSSKWFGYTAAGDVTSATYTSAVKSGKKVGSFTENTAGPVSTVSSESVISHSVPDAWQKYVPNFADETTGTGD